jgi:hypothetical protein
MVLNATKPESALNSRLRNPIFDITPDPTLVTLPPTSLPVDAVFQPDYIMFPTISHLQQLPNPRTKHRRRHQTFQQSPTSRVGTTCFFVTSNLATPPKLTLFQNPEVTYPELERLRQRLPWLLWGTNCFPNGRSSFY